MPTSTRTDKQRLIAQAVLASHGRTFAEELGIRLERGTPAPLFQLLVFTLLASTRISHEIAFNAAAALFEQGWTTPEKMRDAIWKQRVDVLNGAGYARYDESTSTKLGDAAELLIDQWRGDLRRLRDDDLAVEHRRLKAFKGIGDAGADIFLREVQAVWDEARPYVDTVARRAAVELDLPDDPNRLASLVANDELPRLVAGLVRVELNDAYDDIRLQIS